MDIRKLKESVYIESDSIKILLFPNEKSLNSNDWSIVLGSKKEGAFSIKSPGEYETHEVWTMAFNTDPNELSNNVYVMLINGIRVAVFDGDIKKLSNKDIEKIGLIDVLIASKITDIKVLQDNVYEIDPQLFLPVNLSEDNLKETAKYFGAQEVSQDKRIKVKYEDFQNDDYKMRIINLID